MTLDDIKRDIRHDDECASIEGADGWEGTAPECNCTRRDKIALLERLQEPTEADEIAVVRAICCNTGVRVCAAPDCTCYEKYGRPAAKQARINMLKQEAKADGEL